MANESPLSDARSPFLRHGATQPVRWLPWGDEAFERARAANRPILLDVGAVWCHWCHVMDHESYENDATAALINELFVAVKVDRDERPDVDARYQRAVQTLTGQGGWPLTAFLTPDGEVFYGGTYFPPDDRYGRPAFPRILEEIARIWREEPGRAAAAASELRERLTAASVDRAAAGEPAPALVGEAVEAFAREFDFRFGGFGGAPKFPNAGALVLLLDHYLDGGPAWAGRIVAETLEAMARGGIHDQLGGGFHRYSTDARWLVPHFEKMASDNATLLDVYARAAAALPGPFVGEVARGVVRFFEEAAPELALEGGFPASQDADVGPQDDGDYWTWTADEVADALGRDEPLVRAASLHFGLDDPASAMPTDRARHVLYVAVPADEVGRRLELPAGQAERLLAEARARLLAARSRRPRPFVDDTVYANWSALAAAAMIAAERWGGVGGAAERGLRALERLWTDAFDPEVGVAHRPGDSGAGAYLEDQANTIAGMIDAFEWTQEERWLERAGTIGRVMLARFRDPATGALNDRARAPTGVAVLERPHTPVTDSPDPSGNGVAALALLRLGELGDPAARDAALAVLRAFAGTAARLPTAMATFVRALDRAVSPHTAVVVVAEPGSAAGAALLNAALAVYRPRTTVRRLQPGAPTRTLPAALQSMITAASPRAYLCSGRTCAAPVSDPDALARLMREFRADQTRE